MPAIPLNQILNSPLAKEQKSVNGIEGLKKELSDPVTSTPKNPIIKITHKVQTSTGQDTTIEVSMTNTSELHTVLSDIGYYDQESIFTKLTRRLRR
jgi:hypothetical protein